MSSISTSAENGLLVKKDILRAFDQITLADSLGAVTEICGQFAIRVGATNFVYRSYLPVPDDAVTLHNVSDEWMGIYTERHYIEFDPRTLYCFSNTLPIRWKDLTFEDNDKGRMSAEVMREAAKFDQVDGISFPLHAVGSEIAIFNLSSPKPMASISRIDQHVISLYANTVHETVKRILGKQNPEAQQRPTLTDREKQVLKWTAAGKTSWEISKILSLSESTVSFHIKNAVNKLSVRNRAQAVAKAIAQSHISVFGNE